MRVGIAFDLKSRFVADASDPIDRLEEYDDESTVAAIAGALEAEGHRPVPLGGGRSFIERVLEDRPELVFNIAEGTGSRSREAHVPSVLEMLGIPHTHSDPLTLALCLDKALTKTVVAAAGVPTPRHRVVRGPGDLEGLELSFPLLAKPLYEGSSMGVRHGSRVGDRTALEGLVLRLLGDYREPVLVEEFCPGPELTVGIVETDGEPRVLGTMEIAPKRGAVADFVYSLEVKRDYLNQVDYRVPPALAAERLAEAERIALLSYRALGIRDVGRVDLRVGADGEPKFIEVNPLPGLNPVTGDIAILCDRLGIRYQALIGGIVRSALARHGL